MRGMKNQKKRNRKYVPGAAIQRAALKNAIEKERERALRNPLAEDQNKEIQIAYSLSMQAMVQGRGSKMHWAVVVTSLNLAIALAGNGIGEEYRDEIVTALDGAFRCELRANKTGVWAFDGPAIQAINGALDVHEAQLDVATVEDFLAARDAVRNRVKRGVVYMQGETA